MDRTAITINPNLVAGFDVGGTKADVLVYDASVGSVVFRQRYPSSDFASLDELLDQSFRDLGSVPVRTTMAIAGPRRSNGDVQMTNRSWPLFEVAKTAGRLGATIETVNDMVGTAAGVGTLAIGEQNALNAGAVYLSGPKLVITVSTGIGDALLLPDGTPVAAEGGHVTWQPMSDLEYRYMMFLRLRYATDAVTVEVAISGSQGFDNLYDFLVAEGYAPSSVVREQVEACRRNGSGIGRVITSSAVDESDPFCSGLMEVLGSILGQHARNRAVGTMSTGGVFFVGSVMQAPGVADHIATNTLFLRRFVAAGAQHSAMMESVPVFVVTDGEVAVKGALALSMRS